MQTSKGTNPPTKNNGRFPAKPEVGGWLLLLLLSKVGTR